MEKEYDVRHAKADESVWADNRDADEEGISGDAGMEMSDDFMKLYEESLSKIQEGNVIQGEIVQIAKDYIAVDIGYKSEGRIHPDEFCDAEGNLAAAVGDRVEVLLVRKNDETGQVILSKKRAAEAQRWNEIRHAFDHDGTVRGRINARKKGGFVVSLDGVEAFLPASHVDRLPADDPDRFVGLEDEFKVLKMNRRKENVVVSRRARLEAEMQAVREKALERLEEGQVVEGTVRKVLDYGILLDLEDDLSGLVRINNLSWTSHPKPADRYQVGDRVQAKVLRINEESEKISLGVKQLYADQFESMTARYPAGTVVEGTVVGLRKEGAVVALEEGVEGEIATEDMSWTVKIRHPAQVLSVGDRLEVMVLGSDEKRKQLRLGLKQLEENPWERIDEIFPVGAVIEGTVQKVKEFGVFIGLFEGINGMVHVSDLSWGKTTGHPAEMFRKGDQVRAMVLDIDKENRRISLGIKQLGPDPWEDLNRRYRLQEEVAAKVVDTAGFGLFLELEPGVEGLLHISEMPGFLRKEFQTRFTAGDRVFVKVKEIAPDERRITFSMPESSPQTPGVADRNRPGFSSLGDIMTDKLSKMSPHLPDQE